MTQSLVESANLILAGEKVETFHEMALEEELINTWDEIYETMSVEELDNVTALYELYDEGELSEDELAEGLADYMTKTGRLQKKADRSAAKVQKVKDKRTAKAKDLLKQRELGKQIKKSSAEHDKQKAKARAQSGTVKAAKKIGKGAKAAVSGVGKAVKSIGSGLKKVFGKSERPADKKPETTSAAAPKKDTPPPASGGKPKSKLGPIDTSQAKAKLLKRKKDRDAGADIRTQKLEQFRNQWQYTGIQDSHDISVYYDVLAGKTVGEAKKMKKGFSDIPPDEEDDDMTASGMSKKDADKLRKKNRK